MKIVVSKCLLGYNCKYNGGNNYCKRVVDYLQNHEYIMVCPEQLGGLPTPRIPSEIKGNQVINQAGEDVTKQFTIGANKAYQMIENENIELAILKERSPSCGKGIIYDGTFTSTKVEGNGYFARLLIEKGIEIKNENSMFD